MDKFTWVKRQGQEYSLPFQGRAGILFSHQSSSKMLDG